MKITFYGAAQTVTGSRTVFEYKGERYLVDCGLFQGAKNKRELNWKNNIPDVENIKAVFLTHAHIDHSGYLPKIVKDGFKGEIYSSQATKDLCDIMLLDAAHLQEEDAEFANKTGYSHYNPAMPLYNTTDAKNALSLFKTCDFDKWIQVTEGLSLRLVHSGHILGSAYLQFSYASNDQNYLVTFSGDIGSGRSKILKPPQYILETDFLILESTYGDRLQDKVDPEILLAEYLNIVIGRKGVMLIPAFSVGRTQEILNLIKNLELKNKIPRVPVFVDSPMAIDATKIFLRHQEEHLLKLQNDQFIPLFSTSDFYPCKSVMESKILNNKSGPMIIISASGMLTGGRIMHHLKKRLPDSRNGILFTGYQAEETKGKLLVEGFKTIRIHHEEVDVNAEIFSLGSLSGHADKNDLLDWVKKLKRPPKMIFINHGEINASNSLQNEIKTKFGFKSMMPKITESFNLAQWEYVD